MGIRQPVLIGCSDDEGTPARFSDILITALDDDASRLEGLQAGADEFVTKPCHRGELRARVKTIVMLNRFRSIAESCARFEQLFELALMAIVLADPKGRVLHANPWADSLLAFNPVSRLAGTRLATYFDAASAAVVLDGISGALAGKIPAGDISG